MRTLAYTCSFSHCLNATQGLYCTEHASAAKRTLSRAYRDELERHADELRGDIRIAVHLGNLSIAGNLSESLVKAENDLQGNTK